MTLGAWIGIAVLLVGGAVAWATVRRRRQSRPAPAPREDRVGFSVYRPEEVPRGSTVQILAYAHVTTPVPEGSSEPPSVPPQVEEDVSSRLAPGSLVEATTSRETVRFAQSDLLTFRLTVEGCEVSPPDQALRWEAPFQVVAFDVSVPAGVKGSQLQGRLVVYQGIFVRGTVDFSLRLGAAAGAPRPVVGRAFDKVFPSYSHQDAAIVDYVEEAAKTLGHEYLRDIRQLRAGEVWSRRIEELIDEADLFQLFWSSRSMQSPYVRQEWEHALGLQREGFVVPVYWENPLPGSADGTLPPAELTRLHFHRLDMGPQAPSGHAGPPPPPTPMSIVPPDLAPVGLTGDERPKATPERAWAPSPASAPRSPGASPPPRTGKGPAAWRVPRSVWMSAALVVMLTVPLSLSMMTDPDGEAAVEMPPPPPPPPPAAVTVAVALPPSRSLSASQESDLSSRIAAELGVSPADVVLRVIAVGETEETDPEELRARADAIGARYLVTAWADTLRPESMALYDVRTGGRAPPESVPREDAIR